MNLPFRIEKRGSFRVVGYSIDTTNKKQEGRKSIPAFWTQFKDKNLQETLEPIMNREPMGILGISVYNTDIQDSRRFKYFIAAASGSELEGTLTEYTVPSMTWAVFPCTVETIGKTEVQAITKWLPKSGYRPLNSGYITGRMKSLAPDIQYYGKDGIAEVWAAVKEK